MLMGKLCLNDTRPTRVANLQLDVVYTFVRHIKVVTVGNGAFDLLEFEFFLLRSQPEFNNGARDLRIFDSFAGGFVK